MNVCYYMVCVIIMLYVYYIRIIWETFFLNPQNFLTSMYSNKLGMGESHRDVQEHLE